MTNYGEYGYNPNPAYTGYQYQGAPQQQDRQKNFLSQAEIERLMKKQNQFSLALSEEDKLRAFCNHIRSDGSGKDALVQNPDGTYTCQICGYTFKPLDAQATTRESLQAAVNDIDDVLQTIKLLFIDLDPNVAKEYFQIIPLIEKIPDLFDLAVKNYSKHDNINLFVNGKRNLGTAQTFANLAAFLNGAPQQGGFQQAYGAPYGQQPQYQNPYSNGFGTYGTPQQAPGYQPQSQGFAYNPGQYTAQAPQQAAPQAQPNVAAPVNGQAQAAPQQAAPAQGTTQATK